METMAEKIKAVLTTASLLVGGGFLPRTDADDFSMGRPPDERTRRRDRVR